ncbi:MAG: YciI family protein [Acidobacteriota bacterium]
MFLVLIRYVRPSEEVDRVRGEHRAFLQECYRAGALICSGPRTDRTGGVLLARSGRREDVEAMVVRDPYALAGVAAHDIVEFDCLSSAAGFEPFLAPADSTRP